MASEMLNGNDFFVKGNAQVDGSGNLVVESEFNEDYSFAIASRDIFAMNSGNKSVRFLFSASPYKAVTLSNKQGDASNSRFGYIDQAGIANILADIDDTYTVEATESNVKSISVSNTHSVVLKEDGTVNGFGDNTFGQLEFSGMTMAIDVAAGNDFTAILFADGIISIIGNTQDGALDVPSSVSTFDVQDQPIKIDAGDDFVTVLRKDANVNSWGIADSPQIDVPKINDPVVDISCGNNFTVAMTLAGVVYAWGDDEFGQVSNAPAHMVQYIKAGVNRYSTISTSGRLYSYGEQVVVATDGDVTLDTNAIFSIPGKGFVITAGRDGQVVSVGAVPQAVLDITGVIGNLSTLNINNPAYENYPMLKQSDGLNIMFGIQNENMGPEYDKAVAPDGTILPIISGKNGDTNVFTSVQGAIKGAILAKTLGDKDVCFEMSGAEYDPFTFSGHRPVAEGFITNDTEEKYEAIVTFSPFGKSIKFRKVSGSYANEMPFNVIDLNNVPYDQARVVMYIRGAQDFKLQYAEVTDEIDTAILPAEALFRDMDTAILQTRAAQSMVDIMNTMESLKGGLETTADKLVGMGENHRNKILELQDRIVALEG